MDTSFMQSLVQEIEGEKKEDKPTRAFMFGFAVGVVLVSLGTCVLEGLLLSWVAGLLGWNLSFLQGFGLAAVFELIVFRFKQ